jgi:hypothetical protein
VRFGVQPHTLWVPETRSTSSELVLIDEPTHPVTRAECLVTPRLGSEPIPLVCADEPHLGLPLEPGSQRRWAAIRDGRQQDPSGGQLVLVDEPAEPVPPEDGWIRVW